MAGEYEAVEKTFKVWRDSVGQADITIEEKSIFRMAMSLDGCAVLEREGIQNRS